METTRHLTATVYVVRDGRTALHRHPKLGIRLPPGGHVDRDELPHEAGLREVREETGFEATLAHDAADLDPPAGRVLPQPQHVMLYDIDVGSDGEVYHQHVDHVYYARVPDGEIDPAAGEVGAEAWSWYAPADLRSAPLDSDTAAIGLDAIATVGNRGG